MPVLKMAIYKYLGTILRKFGSIARSVNCCCAQLPCPFCIPGGGCDCTDLGIATVGAIPKFEYGGFLSGCNCQRIDNDGNVISNGTTSVSYQVYPFSGGCGFDKGICGGQFADPISNYLSIYCSGGLVYIQYTIYESQNGFAYNRYTWRSDGIADGITRGVAYDLTLVELVPRSPFDHCTVNNIIEVTFS